MATLSRFDRSRPDAPLDRAAVMRALDAVIDPRSGRGLSAAGLVQGLLIREGRVGFMLEVAEADIALYAAAREEAEAVLSALPGVSRAQVVLTAEGETPPAPGVTRVRRGARVQEDKGAALTPHPASAVKPAHVSRLIAVASAKGGVGKSTVAVNLACAFAALGLRTGLVDADIYGPSLPRMMGLSEQPQMNEDKKLIPLEAHGVKCMSIGLIVDEGAPMIWRGPMASSAVTQLLNDVAWGTAAEPLDILVLDLPPGTGDILLTLAQKVAIDGAVIVSTPQPVALIDVRRGAEMFRKTGVSVLGVIENMAYFPDPATGAPIEIFGRGGAQAMADEIAAPFLGELPIDIALRQSGDAGRPLVVAQPDSDTANRFFKIARTLC
jgi:ATP-binding protein involved in chromosome partitioning